MSVFHYYLVNVQLLAIIPKCICLKYGFERIYLKQTTLKKLLCCLFTYCHGVDKLLYWWYCTNNFAQVQLQSIVRIFVYIMYLLFFKTKWLQVSVASLQANSDFSGYIPWTIDRKLVSCWYEWYHGINSRLVLFV